MTAYVKSANGAWNVSANWTPNGIPGSADTVTLGTFTTSIPSGYTAQCGGITAFTGTSESSRSILEITGTLQMYGAASHGVWTTLSFIGSGKIDLRGNSWEVNYTDGTGLRCEITSDGTGVCEIYSSTTLAHFGGAAGGTYYGKLDLDGFKIHNTSFQYGSGWYPGNPYRLKNGVFYNCGKIECDTYVDDESDWFIENVDYRGTQVTAEQQKAWIYCRDKGGTITGIRRFKNVTFDYDGVTDASIRLQYFPGVMTVDTVALRGCYIEALAPILPTWYRLFSSKSGVVGEGGFTIREAVISMEGDNPHSMQNLLSDLQYFYLESNQPPGSTDPGDHFILPNGGTSLIRYGIINDNWGGTCLNALGVNLTGTHTMEHCTIVADIHSADYGIIARNENSGIFDPSATITIRSNIAYARSNVSGFSNIRAINLETAANDQIDVIDHNLITGFGSNISTIYYNVSYSSGGAIGTAINRGLNDKLNINPDFADETRNVQSWATQYGATDYDSAIIYVIDAVNGYNRATQNQDGVVGHTITELLAYLRAGYTPTNPELSILAHDGTTIGALNGPKLNKNLWRNFNNNFLIPGDFIAFPDSTVKTIVDAFWEAEPVSSGVTLVVQDCTHGHSNQAVSLTQANILSVANAVTAHSNQAVSLTQANILSVANTVNAHSSGSPTLVQANVLSVDATINAHTSDSPALVQANAIAVDATVNAHASTSVELIQANTLAVAGTTNAHAVENIDLVTTGAATLVVSDITHAHSNQSLALTQANVLSIQNATNAHSNATVALTQANVLPVDNATTAHSSESVVLVSAGVLSVANTVNSMTSEGVVLLQANVLSVANAVNAHSNATVALTQANTLTVSNTVNAHNVQGVVLTTGLAVTVSDITHASSFDTVTLVQAGVLTVQNTTNAHSNATVALTQANLLTIQDIFHAHVNESPVLTTELLLVVQSAIHNHSNQAVTLTQASTLFVFDATYAHVLTHINLATGKFFSDNVVVVTDSVIVVAIADSSDIVLIN